MHVKISMQAIRETVGSLRGTGLLSGGPASGDSHQCNNHGVCSLAGLISCLSAVNPSMTRRIGGPHRGGPMCAMEGAATWGDAVRLDTDSTQ